MIKAFFQAILILTCLGIAAALGFFGGVYLAPYVKTGLVDMSDMPAEFIEQHRDPAFLEREVKLIEETKVALPESAIEPDTIDCSVEQEGLSPDGEESLPPGCDVQIPAAVTPEN